jgi:hypothetical protein
MHRRGFLAGSAALAGLGAAAPARAATADSAPDLEALEPLFGVAAGPRGLTIRVAAVGCTRKSDFTYYVEHGGGAPTIAFARKPTEGCGPPGPRAGQTNLTFSFAELGVEARTPLRLLNPLVAPPQRRFRHKQALGPSRDRR